MNLTDNLTVGQALQLGAIEAHRRATWRFAAIHWQPIETAPRDGTVVLLCAPHRDASKKVVVGHWGFGRRVSKFVAKPAPSWRVSQSGQEYSPTHWAPIDIEALP